MRMVKRRWIVLGAIAAALVAAPTTMWLLLTYQPEFYRRVAAIPTARRKAEAKRFVAQGLQLRNDIVNEPSWEAIFTDEQVNSWLEEDLVTHFAEQVPAGVHEPRVLFELDRVHLGFQLDQGPVRSVVSITARVRVPAPNELALTIESIRAGIVPISPDQLLDRITDQARSRGLSVRWDRDGDSPVAHVKYTPDPRRRDVVLERLQVLQGAIRLAGRSSKGRVVARPSLPTRKVLQSNFPARRKAQPAPAARENSAGPMS